MPVPNAERLKSKLNEMKEQQKALKRKSNGVRSRALVEIEDEALTESVGVRESIDAESL